MEKLWSIKTPSGLYAEAYDNSEGKLILEKDDNRIEITEADLKVLLNTLNDYLKRRDEVTQ